LRPLVRHFEEEQVRELLGVVEVRQPAVEQDVAAVITALYASSYLVSGILEGALRFLKRTVQYA